MCPVTQLDSVWCYYQIFLVGELSRVAKTPFHPVPAAHFHATWQAETLHWGLPPGRSGGVKPLAWAQGPWALQVVHPPGNQCISPGKQGVCGDYEERSQ